MILWVLIVLQSSWQVKADSTLVVEHVHESPKPMNVLYIVCDDLRPQIMGYNITDPARVPTPNLDKLIAKSTTFTHAYVQIAVCSPSRNSFTTGRRPQNTKIWNFISSFRDTNASWITAPQWFKDKEDYLTNGNGKYFHPGHPPNEDQPYSWTTPKEGGWEYQDPDHQIFACGGSHASHNLSCVLDEPKTVDFYLSNLTQTRLKELKARNGPWMQVVGFLKPHPFWALPQWTFDLFPRDNVPLPANGQYVSNMKKTGVEPSYYACTSINNCNEMKHAKLKVEPYNPLPDQLVRTIRQGYFAGVAHLDRMVGNLLDVLQQEGLADNTIIALHGDHGWELGERGSFCKMGTDELRTRVPLIVHDPSKPLSQGAVHSDPTEIVNVYPTLVELATGHAPNYDLDGVSLAPLFSQPSSPMPTPQGFPEPLAFSVYPRCMDQKQNLYSVPQGYEVTQDPCTGVDKTHFTHMGLAVRSRNYRYVEWRHWDGQRVAPDFHQKAQEVELFNHTMDEGTSFDTNHEYYNLMLDQPLSPATQEVVQRLAAYVTQMWNK